MSILLDIIEHLSDTSLWALDETGKRLEPNNFYGWSPIGKPREIEHNGSHDGLNIIGATEILEHNEFVYEEYPIYETTICSSHVIEYLKKLLEYDRERGVNLTFVILDNAGMHKSKEVKAFARENQDKLALIFQPPYSPKLNPQENIWNWMKKFVSGDLAYKSNLELSNSIKNFKKYLSENHEKVFQMVHARNYYK
jgi:transposase